MAIRSASAAALAGLTGLAIGLPLEATAQTREPPGAKAAAPSTVPLKEAKLNIEHNATDRDTGFQGAVDSEGWKSLEFRGPDGVVIDFDVTGRLRSLGLTELFFESVEPANADVPIRQTLAKLPAGNYAVSGEIPANQGGGMTVGAAWLTHSIPKGAALLAPAEGSRVPVGDLLMRWRAVSETITGDPVSIIAYQLIVEKVGPPHPHMIGKPNSLSMYLPATVTQIKVPGAFFSPTSPYAWEVLAIEESGNQTLSSGTFATN